MTLLLLTWATAILPGVAHTRAAAPHTPASAPSVQLPGLPNFGTISPQLSRGGQPNPVGFEELKKMGIDIIVNLRHDTAEITREQVLVQTQGMQYLSIPWRGSNNPSVAQIVQFLELLRANPDKKVFVHCERGAERTGVMVATYRMSRQHWTAEQALNEMELFGFRAMRFGHLKKFVHDFPSLLESDPRLSRFSAEDEDLLAHNCWSLSRVCPIVRAAGMVEGASGGRTSDTPNPSSASTTRTPRWTGCDLAFDGTHRPEKNSASDMPGLLRDWRALARTVVCTRAQRSDAHRG